MNKAINSSGSYDFVKLASNPTIPVEMLISLASSEDIRIRYLVALHPSFPSNVELPISKNEIKSWSDVEYLFNALEESLSGDWLALLADYPSEHIQLLVAINPLTPAAALTKLSEHESEEVRGSVASNPLTPAKVLAKLSTDGSEEVRRSVASNPLTPAKVLAKLSTDGSEEVRRSVASNPLTPVKVLAKLVNEGGQEVLEKILLNTSTPASLIQRIEARLNEFKLQEQKSQLEYEKVHQSKTCEACGSVRAGSIDLENHKRIVHQA